MEKKVIPHIFAVNTNIFCTRCKKHSSKLDASRSFVAIFAVNANIDCTRCKKHSSELDVSRSFVAIFVYTFKQTIIETLKTMKHKLIALIAFAIALFHSTALTAQEEAGATKAEYGNIVVYLETATWGQDSPYNKFCFTSNGSQAVTGCVPTAYAILMHYHKWPACANEKKVYHSGTGESMMLGHEYEWDNMLPSYSDGYTVEQATAVATLMRDIGYAYQVAYGTGSTDSGAGGEGAGKLIEIFKYKSESPNTSSATMATNRDILANDKLWIEYIKQSLDAGCPIPYSSTTRSGGRHIFILDGYTDKDYFHFNWGWNGQGNGWFKLGSMKPDAYSDYSKSHRAYFMLKPDAETTTISVSVNDSEGGKATVNGKETVTVAIGSRITLVAIPNDGYTFTGWSINGETASEDATYKTKVTGLAEYTANFEKSGTGIEEIIQENENVIYTLQGNRIENITRKGVYIIGNKLRLVK